MQYDTDKIQLTGVTDGSIFGTGSALFGRDYAQMPYKLLWEDGTVHSNYTQNGTLATLHLHVLESAEPGTTTIRFTPEIGYRIDLAETSFYVNGQNADVNADMQMPVVSFTLSGGRDLDMPFFGCWDPLPFLLPFIDNNPVLVLLFYVAVVVSLPFELIEEAGMWIVSLCELVWERIFHPTTVDAV